MAGQQVATATVYLDQQMLQCSELITICLFCNYTLNTGPEAIILGWYGHDDEHPCIS